MKRCKGIFFGVVVGILGVGSLFWIAGTIAWWNAWAFLVFMIPLSVFTSMLIKNSPGLAEERRTAATKAKPWDLKFVRLINASLPAMVIVAALDMRFQWFPAMPLSLSIVAFATMIPSALLTYRAIAANTFFSSHVRIQDDRGHAVVSEGPYGIVRHPGYAGSVVFNLLVPLALGSWATLVPGFGTALLLVYRTVKEDRTLMVELPGYATYAQRVRNRLVPGIW